MERSLVGGSGTPDSNGLLSNAEIANQVISKYAGTASSAAGNKRKTSAVNKDDEEYSKKRARNNVAVKKSREKAKNRIIETQNRVEQLSVENEELQTKVTLLSKELNVLRALFTNGGFTLPSDLSYSHHSDQQLPHSPDSLSSHSGSLYENSHSHSHSHSSHHHSSLKLNVSTSSMKLEESKIPPLRPMPRIANSGSPTSKDVTSSSYLLNKFYSNNTNRDSVFNFSKSLSSSKKDARLSPPILSSASNSYIGHSSNYISPANSSGSLQYKKYYETQQHTSVIRNGPKVTEANSGGLNTLLGKFCIISDPDKNGEIKILPINS